MHNKQPYTAAPKGPGITSFCSCDVSFIEDSTNGNMFSVCVGAYICVVMWLELFWSLPVDIIRSGFGITVCCSCIMFHLDWSS